MAITLDDLTDTQRKLIREVKRGEKISVELSQRLFENNLRQTLQNNTVYLSKTKDSNVSIDKIVGKYGGRVIKYHYQVSQPYIFILSQKNKKLYGLPLIFVESYKTAK